MSDPITEQALAAPVIDARNVGTQQPYPLPLVALGLVATSLAFWTSVIFAVAHLG